MGERPWAARSDRTRLGSLRPTLVSIADPLICYFKTAMSSAAGSIRVPHQHLRHFTAPTTTTPRRQAPRGHHEPTHAPAAHVPDVTDAGFCTPHADQERLDSRLARSTAGKVDSATKAKSRAHSRLASFGRIRPRRSFQSSDQQRLADAAPALPVQRGETLPVKHVVPVSPSYARPQQRSATSTLSNNSSETTLADDKSSDVKSIDEKPAFWLGSSNVPGELDREYDDYGDVGHIQKAIPVQHRPRMMHQTSSRLLRMTEDDRPFTRVCIACFPQLSKPLLRCVIEVDINYSIPL